MSILADILASKQTEVAAKKRRAPLALLQERAADAPQVRDFRSALRSGAGTSVIAEIKKASPSRGVIREEFDPVAIAKTYATNGAACLSVLTDERYFQGRLQHLTAVREHVDLPLLRKDFIIDPWQVVESRVAGADALLLIVAALSPRALRELLRLARDAGMAALVEVHNRDEMRAARAAGADCIGINNRDLHTFHTTLDVTLAIMSEFPADPDRIIVSESGVFTRADVARLEAVGVDAVLVGEALMRATDAGQTLRELKGKEAPVAFSDAP